MGAGRLDEEYTGFVAEHGAALARTALLLAGNRDAASDLLQEALTRVYLRWSHVQSDTAAAYTRRAMTNLVLDEGRRRRRQGPPPLTLDDRPHDHPDPQATAVLDAVDDRDGIVRQLAALTPRERAMVVLRYCDDLSEAAVAAELGVSVGTVKSTCSRALVRLRARTEAEEHR